MTETVEVPLPLTLEEIITQWVEADPPLEPEALLSALYTREDTLKIVFNLAGAQFGLMPFIVSEVLAQVGLGTPMSDEERALIHRNFQAGMEEIRRQMGGG